MTDALHPPQIMSAPQGPSTTTPVDGASMPPPAAHGTAATDAHAGTSASFQAASSAIAATPLTPGVGVTAASPELPPSSASTPALPSTATSAQAPDSAQAQARALAQAQRDAAETLQAAEAAVARLRTLSLVSTDPGQGELPRWEQLFTTLGSTLRSALAPRAPTSASTAKKALMRARLIRIKPLRERDLASVPTLTAFLMEAEQSRSGDDYALCMDIIVSKADDVRAFRDTAQVFLDSRCTSKTDWLRLRKELLQQAFGDDSEILRLARLAWTDTQSQQDQEDAGSYGRRMTHALTQYQWVTEALNRPVTQDWEAERLEKIVRGFSCEAATLHCTVSQVTSVRAAIDVAVRAENVTRKRERATVGVKRSLALMKRQQVDRPESRNRAGQRGR